MFWSVVIGIVVIVLVGAWWMDRRRKGSVGGRPVDPNSTQAAHLYGDLNDRGQFGQPGAS